jgi:hypothetical protein
MRLAFRSVYEARMGSSVLEAFVPCHRWLFWLCGMSQVEQGPHGVKFWGRKEKIAWNGG